jgi:histidinol-phosphate aminotransferase|tara:strand:- start:327 stop:1448 length:1122 start_codon:yes stop_codon:yes gene_type:complete
MATEEEPKRKFKLNLSIPNHILSIDPYSPGKPLEELEREYGIVDSIKLASNENPLGPSPKAITAILAAAEKLNRYPDGSGRRLIEKISEYHSVRPSNIVLGNGSDEIISMLTRTFLQYGDEVILPKPTFLMYDILARGAGATPVYVPLKSLSIDLKRIERKITAGSKMIFINNPNNPTGTSVLRKDFENFLSRVPESIIAVVDEAYIDFARDKNGLNSIDYLDSGKAVVTLRTFSKVHGLAGLRIGYGIMPDEISEHLNRLRQPFNTNSLAQVAAIAALDDKVFFEKTIHLIHEELDYLYDSLNIAGIKYFPTQTNFFLVDVKKSANGVYERMLKEGIIVRSMASYGFPRYIRVNVGLHDENMRFLTALKKVI